MKKAVKVLILILIAFLGGVSVALFVNKSDLLEYWLKRLIEPEERPVYSKDLPKPTTRPINAYSVEQLFNIDTTVVRRINLTKTIETYADVVHPENDLKDITFKINGYVEKLYADFTGKYVKKGEPLVKIYSPELVSAQEEFLRAYDYLNKIKNSSDTTLKKSAQELYDAAYKRLLYWDITKKQIENLKKTHKVFKTMTLYSPYDGWIMEKYVYLGSRVEAGKPLFRIAKHKKLWLLVKIYEQDLPFIKVGEHIDIRFEAYPDKIIHGKIDYIYPMMDFKNRTLNVRVVIDNKNYQFFPGMYSKVFLKIPLGKVLALPETAVLDTGKRQIVFWEREKGLFEPVFIKVGRYVDGYYEIKKGVHEGMVVANSSLFLLDADAQLRGKYKTSFTKHQMHHH